RPHPGQHEPHPRSRGRGGHPPSGALRGADPRAALGPARIDTTTEERDCMERLIDKVAIVTGGGGGIGGATARALAREDAAVLVVDINQAAAELVANGI